METQPLSTFFSENILSQNTFPEKFQESIDFWDDEDAANSDIV